ncbi:MAG: hypothetical protein J6D53_02450 [Blautia sp.]|nr:hypothetical protein [Blautia sp.]
MPDTSDLKEVIIAYKKLSFSDQAAFYAMVPNNFCQSDGHLQSFLRDENHYGTWLHLLR